MAGVVIVLGALAVVVGVAIEVGAGWAWIVGGVLAMAGGVDLTISDRRRPAPGGGEG